MEKAVFKAFVLHGAPRGTILGLRTYDGMSLYFVGKKSNLTGLCEILNNFELKISEDLQKVISIMKILSINAHIALQRRLNSKFECQESLTCWSVGRVLAS